MTTDTLYLVIAVGLALVVVGLLFVVRFLHGKKSSAAPNTTVLAGSLRDEKQKSDIILNAIEDGVVLLDNNQTIQLFNPGASHITGWPANEAQGLNVFSVVKLVNNKGVEYEAAKNPFNRIFKEGQTIRDNAAVLMTRSNKQISISLSLSPLLDANKQVTAAVAIFRDVSEERQEENQRAEFISTASHEMRTPVAAIEGYLALALNDKVSTIDSRARDYLEKAHASTQHLGKLFQDLLTSAKAEDGRLSSHPVVVEMGEYVEQLAQDLKFAAEKKGLFMEFNVGSSSTIDASKATGGEKVVKPLYYVHADPDRLREVITNLFDNAVKYTDEGTVSIGLTGNDQVVQFRISDTGPGIPAEDIPHLFQKFYRVDNTTTRTIGGTGLGLFICRKIVELYQGRIWVESELGKGSTFYINLPRLSTQQATQLQSSEAKSSTLAPITSLTAS
ncbi:MAG TPA: ATP-binding protein [Candidatus Saccharimonadales bacterium]|nr:ATP-binding protein [Candidatus Saccharimonadales bacterium]